MHAGVSMRTVLPVTLYVTFFPRQQFALWLDFKLCAGWEMSVRGALLWMATLGFPR